MISFTPEFQAELDKGQSDPRVLVDGYEFYASDYVPGPTGFDPADALERFAGQEMTWNGFAYRREVISRGDIVLNVGEQTNTVTIEFSNISRYLATWAQTTTIEGLLLCIRCIAPAVTNDSRAEFHGRAEKPGDIDKGKFILTARQDFGNINQTLPPSKFTVDDPEGRLPGDDLYEGIPFVSVSGTYTYPVAPASGGFLRRFSLLARLLGGRKEVRETEQYSSIDNTPYGSPIPEVLGRCQMELIPFISLDKGIFISALWAVCRGPIAAVENIKTRQAGLSDPINSFATPPAPAVVHLGDLGGTGTNQGNTGQVDLGGGGKFSHLAYVEGAIVPTEYFQNPSLSDPNVLNELPTVTAMVLGRRVPLPDTNGEYTLEGWTNNPVHILRFILTDPAFIGINPAFMEDSVNVLTAQHCDEPLMDEGQLIVINNVDLPEAGISFRRYRSSGLITPGSILDREAFEIEDGPYVGFDPIDPIDPIRCPIGQHRDPETGDCVDDLPGTVRNATQPMLRPRYTVNFPITGEIRAVDLAYKVINPAAKLYLKVNGKGKYEIHSEKPADATRLRSATVVGATSVPVLDVTPWKSGPNLLKGGIVLSGGQTHSEQRVVTSADYSTSGNSISLAASSTGSVTATASEANLSGGSTTVQASGTITIGGTPSGSITATIDGVSIGYILGSNDTTDTAATMLAAYINATQRISKYIAATVVGSVITIKCKHGALNVGVAFLKAHGGPIADPTTAPTLAASAGSLQAGTYQVAYADVNANGLTALTLLATITLTANQKIDVSALPAFPAGVTARQFFVSEKTGSTQLRYQATRTNAADFSINALPLPGAALPPSFNTTAEELIRVAMSFATNSQDVFPMRQPSTAVILNDIYLPDPLNGHKYQATVGGTTDSGTPVWPTTPGGTVVDGSVTWTEIGSTVLQQTGLTRANILKGTYKWPLGSRQSSVNQVEIPFRDATNDFAVTTLRINDPVHQAQVKKIYPLKIDGNAIDNRNQAERIGNFNLSKNREGDWFNALETGPQGLALEEGDVICASDDSGGLVNVPTRIEEIRIKPNHEVVIAQARKYSTTMYSDDVGSHVIPIASTLRYVQTMDSIIEFIDSPPLRDADGLVAGFYVAVSRDLSIDGDWRGWALYADYGDGYKQIAQGNVPATLGTATTTLGTPADPSVWDRANSVTFTLKYESAGVPFASVTEQEILSNSRRNLFLIKNEFVQAATVVDNGNRSYTISNLLRGRFGVETPAHLTHGAGERIVFINGAETLVEIDPVRLNGAFNYKAVTTNQDVADATAVSFTWTGGTIKPLAPTNLRGIRDSVNNLLILWDRRSRIGAGLRPYSDVPLGEERDEYLVEVPAAVPPRSWRVIPTTTTTTVPAFLTAITSFGGSIDKNNLTGSDNSGDDWARSLENIQVAGNTIEGTLAAGSTTGGFPISRLGAITTTGDTLTDAHFYIYVDRVNISGDNFATLQAYAYGSVLASIDLGSVAVKALWVRLELIENRVRFYYFSNVADEQRWILFAESATAPTFPYNVFASASRASASVKEIMMTMQGQASTTYTAAQQTSDGFTPGNPVTVRVRQLSAIVGQGDYAEAAV
jgi:hypothetical protein